MKRGVIALLLVASITGSGCMGSFLVTEKIFAWNKHATGDKFINTAIMWVLMILPIYEGAFVLDLAVLNTIEFWSGKNPMAFSGPEKLEKIVRCGSSTARITMGGGVLTVDRLTGPDSGRCTVLRYDRKNRSFYLDGSRGAQAKKIAAISDGPQPSLTFYFPNGGTVSRTLIADNPPYSRKEWAAQYKSY